MTAHVGDILGDVPLVDQDLCPWRLSEQRGRPLVLILHRHLG